MSTEPPQPVLNYATPSPAASGRLARGIYGWILFICLAGMLFLLVKNQGSRYTPISFSQFSNALINHQISEVVIEKDGVRGAMINGGMKFRVNGPSDAAGNWAFIDYVNTHRGTAEVRIDANSNLLLDILIPLVPWVLVFGFIWFFVFRQLRKTQPTVQRPIPVYQVPAPVQQPSGSL